MLKRQGIRYVKGEKDSDALRRIIISKGNVFHDEKIWILISKGMSIITKGRSSKTGKGKKNEECLS